MTFPAYRLPPEVEVGMRGGPTFRNIIQESISGKEQRVQVWASCRGEWDIGYSILDTEEASGTFRAVIALFRAHHADLHPFPFKDWGDYQLTNERFGTGDGSATAFQLTKTYDPSQILLGSPGSRTYVRDIYLPRSGLVIKVNNVTKTLTTDYTIGSTGIITFTSPPTNGHAITATGEFDVPVRFATDRLGLVINEANIAQIDSMPIREVIGSDEIA